ncbi:hypothetical protein [Nesterenkonia suensis]
MSADWNTGEPTGAHPGRVFPIRRMTLGEVLGGGFSMIRHAPKAVLGVPFVAGMISFVLSMLAFALAPSGNLLRLMYDPMAFEDEEIIFGMLSNMGFWAGLTFLTAVQYFLMAVAYALIVIPTLRAAYGYRTGFAQTLRLRSGRLGWLVLHLLLMHVFVVVLAVVVIGLSVVIAVVTFGLGLLLVLPGLLLLGAWLTAGLMYAPLVVLVEHRGPLSAFARSWRLNRGRWWINIGTVALIYLMTFVMLTIASLPVGIVSMIGGEMAMASPEDGTAVTLVLFTVATFFDSAVTAVFLGLVGALVAVMYLNCRIHQESVDVSLLTAADGASDDGGVIPASVEHLGEPTVPMWGGPGGSAPPWGSQQAAPGPMSYGQTPYGQQAGQNPYGQQPGQSPYGQNPYGQQPGQTPYGQSPYGQQPGQTPYGQSPYGQQPGQSPYGQSPYGQNPYGQNPSGQNPSGQNPQNRPDAQAPEDQGPDFGQPR